MANLFKIFPLVLLLSITFSCNRGKEIGGFYLTEEMKSQIPFKGHETISFVDNNGEIFTFSGGYRVTQEIEVTECISCYDYYVFEEVLINFNNELDEIRLIIRASYESYLRIRFTFDRHVFGTGFSSPLSPENLKDQECFIDSITINNTNYYDVYKDTMYCQESLTLTKYPIYSYYSIEYGVLKIDFSDNTCWELNNTKRLEK